MKRKLTSNQIRNKVAGEEFYQRLDPGILFAVRVLHANGIDTCQSCAGSGPFGKDSGKRNGDSHPYPEPTVDMVATGNDALGFAALAHLHEYGLPVAGIALWWNISNGLPYEKLWRITFVRPAHERADDIPMFTWGYQANDLAAVKW